MAARPVTCPSCSGAQTLPTTHTHDAQPCPECDGSGWVMLSDSDDDDDEEALVSQRPGEQDRLDMG